jgi:hypothetical protein
VRSAGKLRSSDEFDCVRVNVSVRVSVRVSVGVIVRVSIRVNVRLSAISREAPIIRRI